MRKIIFPLLIFAILLVSCTNDAYETGDSRYSYLRTDFVEIQTDANGNLITATRDDDVQLAFTQSVKSYWANVPDSTYRALLYYNIGDSTSIRGQIKVQPLSLNRVYVLDAKLYSDTLTIEDDPVYFQSAWVSKNRSYANLSLALMTGMADSLDTQQSIGLICDSVKANLVGGKTYYYRLSHNQGNVPQYYKSTIYVSMPTKNMNSGDVIRLTLTTYDGKITREFDL